MGERMTLADITVVCTLLWLYKQVLEPSFRQAFPNTNRWFLTCINQPQIRAVLGEVKLCEKMAQFDGKSEVRGHAGRIRGLVCSVLTPRFPVWVLGYVDTQNIGHRV